MAAENNSSNNNKTRTGQSPTTTPFHRRGPRHKPARGERGWRRKVGGIENRVKNLNFSPITGDVQYQTLADLNPDAIFQSASQEHAQDHDAAEADDGGGGNNNEDEDDAYT